jgi:hypothetical protein
LTALTLMFASSWVVLPVHSANPPPQDPTLLRLSRSLATAIHDVVGEEVRVASREERDERCPQEDGACPKELAELLNAERAIVLVLDAKYTSLTVRIYRGKLGLEREGRIPCRWESGAVACETSKLAPIFAEDAGPGALKESEVESAFKTLSARLDRCRAPRADEAWVNFRVRPDGNVYDVRIDPKELGEERGYACVATTVESMKLRTFSGPAQSFRYRLKAPKK